MSDLMLHAILGMPPELWSDDPIDIAQRYARYLQASRMIDAHEVEIERLREQVTALEDLAKALSDSTHISNFVK